MKLIAALGNPGRDYFKTRHNAGWMALDKLLARLALDGQTPKAKFHSAIVEGRIGSEKCVFLKPTTYMNKSGIAIAEAMGFYKADPSSDLLVLVDEVALDCGTIRLRPGGGSGGHNGLADIKRALGSDAYPRLRIGIGPKPAFIDDRADFVLGRFTDDEMARLAPALDRSAKAVESFVRDGLDAAMNAFNTDPAKKAQRAEGKGDGGKDTKEAGGETPPVHPGWLEK